MVSSRRLLLADDSITIQKVVNLTFADEGIEVLTVGDGDSAMEKMADFKPDLIMADVNMPGLNGYQICEKIKQSDDLNQIPVILLVGSFEPFDETEAKRVGADDFLTKPFQSIRQLVSKVTELLESSQNAAVSDKTAESENIENRETAEKFSEPETTAQNNFEDDKLDDEMIQTSSAGYGLDQVGKFETKESYDSSEEDSAKTQPLPPEETRQFSFAAPEHSAGIGGYAANNDIAEPHSAATDIHEKSEENTAAKFSAADDLDDDFLEIPFDEDEEEIDEPKQELQSATEHEVQPAEPNLNETFEPENAAVETNDLHGSREEISASNQTEDAEPVQATEQGETGNTGGQSEQNSAPIAASTELSAATIDLIVQKVVERLSDKAVKEVAWEVVPQMTDLIVKKMAEEKMKES